MQSISHSLASMDRQQQDMSHFGAAHNYVDGSGMRKQGKPFVVWEFICQSTKSGKVNLQVKVFLFRSPKKRHNSLRLLKSCFGWVANNYLFCPDIEHHLNFTKLDRLSHHKVWFITQRHCARAHEIILRLKETNFQSRKHQMFWEALIKQLFT